MQAATGTVDGDVVIWGRGSDGACEGLRQAIKVVRLHSCAITVMLATPTNLVTGGADGNVRFFDPRLRLTAWFEVGCPQSHIFYTHKNIGILLEVLFHFQLVLVVRGIS